MIKDGGKDVIFSHSFITKTWNLICRSKNTVQMHMDHVMWATDSVIIKFAHTKTDQTGDFSPMRDTFMQIPTI